jgi:uncharacterized protein (DUF2141 family)
MKKFIISSLTLLSLSHITNIAQADELQLTVSNIKKAEGTLYIRIYDSKQTWLSQDKTAPKVTELVIANTLNGKSEFTKTFTLPKGQYAASVIHDLNNNGVMDKTWIGIPTEPVGETGNGAKKNGPPAFEDSVFELSDVTQKTVVLHNY